MNPGHAPLEVVQILEVLRFVQYLVGPRPVIFEQGCSASLGGVQLLANNLFFELWGVGPAAHNTGITPIAAWKFTSYAIRIEAHG